MPYDAAALLRCLDQFRGKKLAVILNGGNAGDAAIACGTWHLFRRAGLDAHFVDNWPAALATHPDVVAYGGGGNLVGQYQEGFDIVAHSIRSGVPTLLFPHTIIGRGRDLVALGSNLEVFCREASSEVEMRMAGMPLDRLHLMHDLAFQIDPHFIDRHRSALCFDRAYAIREDSESLLAAIPQRNRDISASWNGQIWSNEILTEAVVGSLLAYISAFRSVVTDRLHVAILGSLLGTEVHLLPNSYGKNKAVFEHSLQQSGVVSYHDNADAIEALIGCPPPLPLRRKLFGWRLRARRWANRLFTTY